jgi:CubicO group peptidase (beta-lactamase class C family)
VLRLAEQKRLTLDTPITTYLPEFRSDTGRRVTFKHLLSNTSGIPDLLSRQIAAEPELRSSNASAAAIVARFSSGDPLFLPGEGWDYSALNWVIVAAALERLTGVSFPDLMKQLVLRPLRMSGAGYAQPNQPVLPHLAAAYSAAAPHTRKMSPAPAFVAATGNVAGTVGDAILAADGVFHGPLLSRASRKALTTILWQDQEYALGGRIHQIDGNAWSWETGKVGGYRAHIAHRLDRSETIVIFNTTDMDQSVIGEWAEMIAKA